MSAERASEYELVWPFCSLMSPPGGHVSHHGHVNAAGYTARLKLRPSTSRHPILMASTAPRTRDNPRAGYPLTSPEPFGDDFYHTRRPTGRLAMLTTLPAKVYKASVVKFGRRRGPALLCFCCLALLLSTYALHQRFTSTHKAWPGPWRSSKAEVFGRDEWEKIWDWEVRSGHYPSTRPSESVLPSF